VNVNVEPNAYLARDPDFAAVLVQTCWNSSNTASCFSGAMPTPGSVTEKPPNS
jgi:hypothetical protein